MYNTFQGFVIQHFSICGDGGHVLHLQTVLEKWLSVELENSVALNHSFTCGWLQKKIITTKKHLLQDSYIHQWKWKGSIAVGQMVSMSFCSLLSVSETFHLLFFLCSCGFSLDGARAQIFEKQKTVFCNRYCCKCCKCCPFIENEWEIDEIALKFIIV